MGKRDDPPGPLEELARGFRKRTWVTARLMAKMGAGMARRNLGFDKQMEEVDEEDAVRAARELLAQLDGLKGLAMKLGQMASYLDTTMPPKARRILARLQSGSRPMAPEVVAEVIRAELGGAPDEVFEAFEPEPFAAASIGQVHRARLEGGSYAVKIQYPGVDELMAGDVTTIGRLSRFALLFSPVDGKGLVEELGARLGEECDYEREADNQELAARVLAGVDGVRVPAVRRDRSTGRVLTTELVRALGFDDFCDRAGADARNRAGALIYGTCFATIFEHCVYNADPHPGNYLFSEAGDVTLLDFGCVKRFDPTFVRHWKALVRSLLDDDFERFRRAWQETGFVGRARRFDYRHQFEAMRFLYRPMTSPEPFHFTHAFVREVNDRLMFKNDNKLRMALPPDWLFVNRLQWGLLSVLAHLDARFHAAPLFRAAVEAPTRAAWQADSG